MICGLSARVTSPRETQGPRQRDSYIMGYIPPSIDAPRNNTDFYGWDMNTLVDIWGYKTIQMNNIYSERLPMRFSCLDNLNNPIIKMIFRCINGINISDLSDDDKEIASKALSIKIIKRQGDVIYPNILIFDRNSFSTFEKIIWDIGEELNTVKDSVINEFTELVKKYVPRHLLGQSRMLIQLTSNMRHLLIEKCIEKGLTYIPDRACCSEGVWAVVEN